MKHALIFSILTFLGVTPAAAEVVQANILTGGPTGTYIQIGRDISAVAKQREVDLIVNESRGSMENIYGVYQRPQTQLGIVQSDVLDFIRNIGGSSEELTGLVDKVRLVMPLYNEEIHLVAAPGLQTLGDLANARVSLGPENSGTQLTATLMLDAMDLQPKATEFLTPADSLEAFLEGKIDAFFYVGGAPIKLLQDPRLTPENAHILPLDDERLAAYYVASKIPAGTYGFQTGDYDGLAVKAVLMTYEFGDSKAAYYRNSCDIVSRTTAAILENMDDLRDGGHPKWASVDLEDIPPGWEKGKCVLTGEEMASHTSTGGYTDPAECESIANPITRNLCVTQTSQ